MLFTNMLSRTGNLVQSAVDVNTAEKEAPKEQSKRRASKWGAVLVAEKQKATVSYSTTNIAHNILAVHLKDAIQFLRRKFFSIYSIIYITLRFKTITNFYLVNENEIIKHSSLIWNYVTCSCNCANKIRICIILSLILT